ncbi:MAG TPA: response regulator transcription factor [Pirellulaceae bacterium]|mgnify:CR=1 FL=1|nr:response regulator transcription factor [Planctomycetales bacterium]MCB9938283.1 response regulator transcription factor [Planctomycetaceae bacterium]HRX80910.1 response regulator transcription factor [Pirellulaceae bacterium]
MSIRIIVADDRDLIRAGLREFVRATDLEVVAEGTVSDAARLVTQHDAAQLLILGLEPPGTDGLALVEQMKASRAKPPAVLIYAARTSAELIAKAIAVGTSGLLLHDANHETFLQSIHSVVLGESLWSREDLRRAGSVGRLTDAGADVQLTRRESEVIVKMVEGLTNKQIAQHLEISYETVKEHVQHILRKLGVTDRTQAAVWAVRHGLA